MAVLAALFLTLMAVSAAASAQEGRPPMELWVQDALTRALAASDDIADPLHRAQALAEISEAHAAAGDAVAARRVLLQAASVAQGIEEDALRSWALHDIGLAYVKADALGDAETTAESIRDPRLHDVVLAAVVDTRRGARDIPGALATAKRIRDAARQGQSLRTIAILQASEGDFSAALLTARSIQHSLANALALGDVAAAMARDGHFTEPRSLVERIRDSQGRSRALVELSAAMASTGNIKSALEVAALVDDKLAQAEGLARIAAARSAAEAGESNKLLAQSLSIVAKARGSAIRRSDALIEIARAQLVTGDPAASMATLKQVLGELPKIKNEPERLGLLSRIAPLQARAGDFAGAFATAMRADDRSLRPLLVRDIAATQAEKGDVPGAVAAARGLDDRPAAAAALFGILRVQAQARDTAGMHETSGVTLQAVRFIGNAELRAGALGSLAATHVLQGDVEQAQALFKEAMNTAAALEGGQQRAAGYARIADSLADRHRAFLD